MDKGSDKDRREGGRQEARIKIRFATPEALQKEYTSNINKGGLFVNTKKPHPLRSKVKFVLTLPQSNEVVELTGEVVHCIELKPGMDPSQAGIGVQFIDLDQKKRAVIENYICRIGEESEYDAPDVAAVKEEKAPEQKEEKVEVLKDAIRRAAKDAQGISQEELTDLKRKIKLFYAKRADKNHYDLLGIGYTASPEAVRNAYHKLSMGFHPDRHHKRLPADLRPQIEDIFGRINRAYKTLRDTESRLDYDVSVSNWSSVPDMPELSEEAKRRYMQRKTFQKKFPEKVARAAEILEEAEKALAIDDKQGATVKLKLANSFDPFNERARHIMEGLGIKVKPLADMDI